LIVASLLTPPQNLEAEGLGDPLQGGEGKLAGLPYDLIRAHG
jgi:hypothetical protein